MWGVAGRPGVWGVQGVPGPAPPHSTLSMLFTASDIWESGPSSSGYWPDTMLFMSGGAYRPGDLELGRSQAPRLGSLIELGEIGFTCFSSELPPSVYK